MYTRFEALKYKRLQTPLSFIGCTLQPISSTRCIADEPKISRMKKTLLIPAFLVAISMQAQNAAYTFASSGTIDASGNGNDATVVGTLSAATDRFGNDDCAIHLPGTDTDYLVVDFSEEFDIPTTGQFSISCWYKGGSEDGGDYEELFTKYDAAAPYGADFGLALYDLNKPLIGGVNGYSAWSALAPPYLGDINGWNHVVGVYDNGTFTIYVNGYVANYPVEGGELMQSQVNTEIHLGRNFEGDLDDVYFFNTAITDFDVIDLYNENNSCAITLATAEVASVPSFSIFPNPCDEMSHIDCSLLNGSKMQLEVVDIAGRTVVSETLNGAAIATINTASLTTGIYTMRIVTADGTFTQRLLKN
jgi:hypothetical protein